MISTRDLSRLPNVEDLRRTLRAIAMLDAILSPEWESRYYSFDSAWGPFEEMGSMRNGSGDHFFSHFSAAGCWLKGFAHESPLSPWHKGRQGRIHPGVIDAVPREFADCLKEPAFCADEVTFCIWRRPSAPGWESGHVQFPADTADPDGSESLLSILDGQPESYQTWAKEYFDCDVSLVAVQVIYQLVPLTDEIVKLLNPELSLSDLRLDLEEIGYPV